MKFLLIVDPIDEKRPAGLGRSVYQFALSLMGERSSDEFIVVTKHAVSESAKFSGVTVPVEYVTTNGVPLWRANINHYARQADCIISFTPLIPIQLFHPHIIVFAHDFAYITYGSLVHRNMLRLLHSITFLKAAYICCVSNSITQELKKYFWFSSKTTVAVVYNGFDHFKPRTATISAPISGPYFLSVGVLKERKNTLKTVEAFKLFLENNSGYILIIIGNSATVYGTVVQTYIQDNGLNKSVVMKNFVSDDELAQWYTHATALIFPSVIEGFGFPLLEAMSYNAPVITSKHGALAEVAGDAALLIEPTDSHDIKQAMECILSPLTSAGLIQKGALRIKDFTWHESAQTLSTIIDTLIPHQKIL